MYKEINKELGTTYDSDKEIKWEYIVTNYRLSESFIEKYKDYLGWFYILRYQKLSEEFIKKWIDELSIFELPYFQTLSEEFIEEHQKNLSWVGISKFQKLSKGFIKKYCNELNWKSIFKYQNLDDFDYYLNFVSKKDRKFYREFLKYNIYNNNLDNNYFISYIVNFEDLNKEEFLKSHNTIKKSLKLTTLYDIKRNILNDCYYPDKFLKIYKVYIKDKAKIYNNISILAEDVKILREIRIINDEILKI